MYLDIEFIKGHDGSEVEEGEVEVVLEQLQDAVVTSFPLAVLQSKAHAAHYGEAATTIKEHWAQSKVSTHEPSLQISDGLDQTPSCWDFSKN